MAGARNVPRTANEQFVMGQHVPVSEMVAGDLIFWSGTQKALGSGQASHVAMYLGDGRFADAGSKGVTIRNLQGYSPSKRARFLGVRRFPR